MTAVLPEINGQEYPRIHPAWCDEASHAKRWESAVSDAAAGLDTELEESLVHEETVGAGWWPAVLRCQGPPTRPKQGTWEVLIRNEDRGPGRITPDDVVRLSFLDNAETVVNLLACEARSLAAVLIRAADLLEFE